MKTVLVTFAETPGKEYSFFTDIVLEKGDLVVVDTAAGYKVARVCQVTGFTEAQMGRATKWVVQRIDIDAHVRRMENAARIREIHNKLEARRKSIESYQVYKMLAEKDIVTKELLDELKAIDPARLLT